MSKKDFKIKGLDKLQKSLDDKAKHPKKFAEKVIKDSEKKNKK